MYQNKAARHQAQVRRFRIWCGIFFFSGVLLTAGVRYLVTSSSRELRAASAESASPRPLDRPARLTLGPKGPWGVLEYERIVLRNFTDVLTNDSIRLEPARWIFEGYSADRLGQLFRDCVLTDGQRTFLLDTRHWQPLANGFAIVPTDELVLGLGQPTRQQLYAVLAANPVNHPQADSFRFPIDGFRDRFEGCGLRPELVELVRQQTYTNAGALCLAIERPLEDAMSSDDFKILFRACCAASTWRVSLRVMPDTDVNALAKYWGKGGREHTIHPLLGSLAMHPAGQSLNIAYFLPAFARLNLYTYPDPAANPGSLRQDCFYSALNFFNEQPNPALADGQQALNALRAGYFETSDHRSFGDLMLVSDPAGHPVHACVYVAEDFVFTKNGTGEFNPWVLMKIPEVLAAYPVASPSQVKFFRRNGT